MRLFFCAVPAEDPSGGLRKHHIFPFFFFDHNPYSTTNRTFYLVAGGRQDLKPGDGRDSSVFEAVW